MAQPTASQGTDSPGLARLSSLIGKRPAELATAAAGAVGLLLATLLAPEDDWDSITTGLVVLLAALPALVSFVHDLGRAPGHGARHARAPLRDDLEELSSRAIRRARMGDHAWKDDLDKVTAMLAVKDLWATPMAPTTEKSPTKPKDEAQP